MVAIDDFKFDHSLNDHAVAKKILEEDLSIEKLKSFESEYLAADARNLALMCLLAISRKIPFDENLRDSFRLIAQSEIKAPRDAYHELKDDFSKRCDAAIPVCQKFLDNLCEEIRLYFKRVSFPIIEICNNLLKYPQIADDFSLRHPISKLRADVCRYTYEVLEDTEYQKLAIEANEQSWNDISATNPSYSNNHYLGVVLNHSVFIYGVLGDVEKAIEFAKKHLEEAKKAFPNYNEKNPQEDGARIVKLLEENIKAWTSDDDEKSDK